MTGAFFIGLVIGWLAGESLALRPAARLVRLALFASALVLGHIVLNLPLAALIAGVVTGATAHLIVRAILTMRSPI